MELPAHDAALGRSFEPTVAERRDDQHQSDEDDEEPRLPRRIRYAAPSIDPEIS